MVHLKVGARIEGLCVVVQMPEGVEQTPVSLIDTEADLQQLCDLLATHAEIAVDLEVSDLTPASSPTSPPKEKHLFAHLESTPDKFYSLS